MSLVTKAIGCAKKVKHSMQDELRRHTPVYLSPVRRIERVALHDRVVAMTFDDGPCAMAANPSDSEKALTLALLEALEKFGARGTFDVVGDTSENYPDRVGKQGTVNWGGVRFDHYPEFGADNMGGVKNCPELTHRILQGGHEITSHTWSHVLFGPKPLVYGSRSPMKGIDDVISDLRKMDCYMRDNHGYSVHFSRPPHYVDKTKDGFCAYDAYAVMGYQYLAASFDGAGWLPLASYEAEVEAMLAPLKRALADDPDSLCGQIIFHKDGYNMARRSPVADGLEKQLELLYSLGYRVVTVSELTELCPFSDLSPDDPLFAPAKSALDSGVCICYRDNTVRADNMLTRAELAMMLYGCETASRRIEYVRLKQSPSKDMSYKHPYSCAVYAAIQSGAMKLSDNSFNPNGYASYTELADACLVRYGKKLLPFDGTVTHGAAIAAIGKLLNP